MIEHFLLKLLIFFNLVLVLIPVLFLLFLFRSRTFQTVVITSHQRQQNRPVVRARGFLSHV